MASPEGDRTETNARDSRESIRLATFDQYRGLLFSVAYRMLGSVADAEDMLQETFIRWQQASDEDIQSPRSFLVTIISRLCINHLQSARVRREQYVGQWLPEPLITGAGNEPMGIIRVDESISMAFLVLLERLTLVERAVFILREVFECVPGPLYALNFCAVPGGNSAPHESRLSDILATKAIGKPGQRSCNSSKRRPSVSRV
jgi:RNA polymerase sigma factor (sigma-70 family)